MLSRLALGYLDIIKGMGRLYHHGLRHIGLDVDDGTQLEKDVNERRRIRRQLVHECHHSNSGFCPLVVEVVFDTDGEAMKWAGELSLFTERVKVSGSFLGLREHCLC
jgi:hypothetical protein